MDNDLLRISALAQAMATSRIVHAITQQLFANGMLGRDDVQMILASALSELDETTSKPLLPEFGRALRVAKTLVEQEMETIMDG
jgi:hypothetical protein